MSIDTHPELRPTDGSASPAAVTRRSPRWWALVLSAVLVAGLVGGFGIGRLVDGSDSSRDSRGGSSSQPAATLVTEGLQLQVDGDLAGAASRYRDAIESDPDSVLAHYNLGLVHQLEGRAGNAVQEYERTVALDPTYVPALFNLGVLASASGDKDAALGHYRKAVQINPGFAGAQFNLGLLLLETGEEKAGNKAIKKALELDPSLADRLEKGTP